MSAERGEGGRARKREGRGRSEGAIQGTCPLSPSEHRGGGGAHELRETHSHIFTACSSDWQQQTELGGSTVQQGGEIKRIGNKWGIHREEETTGFSLLSLWEPNKESPLYSSWSELALLLRGPAPCYGSPGGTWEHHLPLILLLSLLDYSPLGSLDPFKPSVGI